MRKIVFSGLLFIVMSCQQQRIGFVDNVKLMDKYQEKIDIEAKYKVQSDALNKRRDSVSQAFQMEAQQFQSKAQTMAQKEAQEQYGQLQQRGQMIGQQLQQEEQKLQSQGQVEMDTLITKVKEEIRAYGESHDYTYILGGGDGGSVLFGNEGNDLTDEILKMLNEKYKK